jgi:hypothetical protein
VKRKPITPRQWYGEEPSEDTITAIIIGTLAVLSLAGVLAIGVLGYLWSGQ